MSRPYVMAGVGVLLVAATTLIASFAGHLRAADTAGLATIELAIIAIAVAADAARSSAASARSGEATVGPLQQRAAQLEHLVAREEGIVVALGSILRQADVAERRRRLPDEIDVLRGMVADVYAMAYLVQEEARSIGGPTDWRAEFFRRLVSFRTGFARFPRNTLHDGIRLLNDAHLEARAAAPTTAAVSALEGEIAHRQSELQQLVSGG